jgi:acetolactate synthase I/II/III large subunit
MLPKFNPQNGNLLDDKPWLMMYFRLLNQLKKKDVTTIAEALANAVNPLIVTSYAGKNKKNVALLVELAETLGCGVLESIAGYVNFPASHYAHLGSTLGGRDLEGHIKAADVILVFESGKSP